MAYVPPLGIDINFSFTEVLIPLNFNFSPSGYSPPVATAINFTFTIPLFPLDFEFAPELPPPISKELFLALSARSSGQVYKYWVAYISHGKQCVRRYFIPTNPKTPAQTQIRNKWAAGVQAWKNLSQSDKLYWRRVGVRKKHPITSINAWMSAWMKDKI